MKLHRKIAKLFNYELIKRRKQPTVNSHIINIINLYKIDLVLDVGANLGQYGQMLRDEGYKGEIHSFEPVTETFAQLSKNCLKDKKWFTHKIALGSAAENKTVNISESSDLSSFLQPNAFGKERYEKMKITETEIVEVSTVDIFLTTKIANFNQKNILLKMDTQGYDLNVFKGALKSITSINCILSEISLIPIYSGMPHYLDSLKTYENHGFIITGLYPISRKKDLSVVEMDCVLTNAAR